MTQLFEVTPKSCSSPSWRSNQNYWVKALLNRWSSKSMNSMHKTKHPRRAWFIALHRYYVSTYLTMISTLFLTVFSLSFSQLALASATAVSLAKDSSDSLSFCQMSLKWASCRLSITCSVWHPRCVIWNGQYVRWNFTATISINNVGNQKGHYDQNVEGLKLRFPVSRLTKTNARFMIKCCAINLTLNQDEFCLHGPFYFKDERFQN